MRKITIAILLLSLYSYAQDRDWESNALPDQKRSVRDNVYDLLYLQGLEIMLKAWGEWEKYPQNQTAESWYWGARLTYRGGNYRRAVQYLKRAEEQSEAPRWIKQSAHAWQSFITTGKISLPAEEISPRALSELAVLLREAGNPQASKCAFIALQGVKEEKEPYWENLAISQPPDIRVWEEALEIAFRRSNRASPFFDPALLLSLFEFWEKAPEKMPLQWSKNEPLCHSDLTPNNVLGRENEFSIFAVRRELDAARQGRCASEFLSSYEPQLWALAWLYGHRGFVYYQCGDLCAAQWNWQSSAVLYDVLFVPSRRGNVGDFDLTAILEMSRVWMAVSRYEEMLAYIYRPDPIAPLEDVSRVLRPVLQFLLAAQVTQKYPGDAIEVPDDPFALMFYGDEFSFEHKENHSGVP